MTVPTPHLEARAGEIAELVLLPGDPLRAQFIADNYLRDAVCYNRVRNMLGFTGTYEGVRVSVQGTGMGMPSISIYLTELLRFYGVKTAIRIGSCGALSESVHLRDLILAISAHTTSNMNRRHFNGIDYAPSADFGLLSTAHRVAAERNVAVRVGPILSSDAFYDDDAGTFDLVAAHGTLAVEMEAAALYTIAAREGARALCIATVSDHLKRHEVMSAEDRQTGMREMIEVALATLISKPLSTHARS
jgi:purine-nucleoside phosphorylase